MVASLLIGLVLAAPAQRSTDELRLQAEEAFASGVQLTSDRPNDARSCFGCAAALFDGLRRRGADNPALCRNIGNAYLLARAVDDPSDDSLARAVLAYRRGLRLDPADMELQRGLEFAREQVVYAPSVSGFGQPPIENRPPWLPRWPRLLLGLAIVAYGLGCMALVRWWMVRQGRWLTIAGCCLAGLGVFVGGWALEAWQLRQDEQHPLVVVARDGVQLLVGNGRGYPARYDTPLNRGVEARLRYDRGHWLQVELSGGEIGWVPRSAVLIDEP